MPRTDVSTSATGAWIGEGGKTLLVERIFKAPRELVFKAFTDPAMIVKWWGPREWPTTNKVMDVRPGGVWHYHMTGPDGTEAWGKAVYKVIIPVEKVVWVDYFSDAEGNESPEMPSTLATFNFVDLGDGRTKMSSMSEYASAEQLKAVTEMGVVSGLSESLDKLDELLETLL